MFMIYFLIGAAIVFFAMLGYAKYKGKLGHKEDDLVIHHSEPCFRPARYEASAIVKRRSRAEHSAAVVVADASSSSCDGGGGDGGGGC